MASAMNDIIPWLAAAIFGPRRLGRRVATLVASALLKYIELPSRKVQLPYFCDFFGPSPPPASRTHPPTGQPSSPCSSRRSSSPAAPQARAAGAAS